MTERVTTTLRFVGDWPWWLGVSAAVVLGATAFALYRRDVRPGHPWLRTLLPASRALVVALIVLMLSGPVLHHRKVIGDLTKLLLFVDGSRSMELTDPAMPTARKIMILQRMGLLASDAVKMELPRASEALADAQSIAEKAKSSQSAASAAAKKLAEEFAAKIADARGQIEKAGGGGDRLPRFTRELHEPARDVARREMKQTNDRARATQELARMSEVARRWQDELSEAFQRSTGDIASADNSALRGALQKFDTLPRWERVQGILLGGGSDPTASMLAKFAETYDVQLVDLHGSEARKIWQPTAKDSTLPTGLPKPAAEATNLATGVKASAAAKNDAGANEKKSPDEQGPRGAVVIFSDGQHNEGESPVEVAKLFSTRAMPIFTIGIGSQARPRDLAVVKTEAPDAVFYQDRVRGQITLKDDLAPGMPFKVSIREGDKIVWEQQLISEGKQLRKVPFSFDVKGIVEPRLAAQKDTGVQVAGVPLEMKVAVSQVEGDREPSNNEGGLRLRAVTQKRKLLIIDGRPRWETRYIRNLFERDEQWEVNAIVANTKAGDPGFARGALPEQFPNERGLLDGYDLIVFGEVPRALWKGDELAWIKDFVSQRGGALVFVDGARGRFKDYADTPIGPLFPVEWKGASVRDGIMKVALTDRSANLAAFSFAGDKGANSELWAKLQPPHWLSGATALPGAETLLEAETRGGKLPALVHRPFGAGRVLYQAFDDSWRWRYEVADEYHVKYWNQIANWVAELPFAVRDRLVSLDAGAVTYRPGESADIRVRLRDGEGRPVSNATVDAVLFRDGKKAATIRLSAEDNAGGLFRGKTAALEPGSYEVAVQSPAIAERDSKARTSFTVTPRETGELTLLNLNEELLRQVASTSGGQYLREENADKLVDLLAPMSQGKVIETDTVLWQSWWWFLPLIGLLTIEWIVRKRSGLL